MLAWRVSGAVLALLVGAVAGRAQEHALAEAVKPGDSFRYQLEMKLAGEIRVYKDGKLVPIKLSASASHSLAERVMAVGATGLVEKAARLYDMAKATIGAGEDRTERALRPERKLVVAQRMKEQKLVYSPSGPLTRAELDVISEHFDTLSLPGVLPGKGVKAGDTWAVPNPVVQALCNFEGLTEQKLAGKLVKVEGDVATFSLAGPATGVESGALVKLTIEATGKFDLKARRLTGLEWKQQDARDQGPVSPATSVEVTVVVTRQPVEQPAALTDVGLVSVPADPVPPAAMTNLEYRDPKGRFGLLHAREWLLVAETGEHAVMRLLDRGDFVAQVTVTPWTAAKKGEHLSPEEFKAAMNNTSGWRPEKELQAEAVPADETHRGRWIYRLSELGQLDGVTVLQNFYLVAAPTGEQVVLTFTLSPKQADKLGARDLSLAASVELPAKK